MKSRQIFRSFLDSLQRKGSEGKRREAKGGLEEERMALWGGARGRSHTASTHGTKSCHMTENPSEKPSRFPHVRTSGEPESQTQ